MTNRAKKTVRILTWLGAALVILWLAAQVIYPSPNRLLAASLLKLADVATPAQTGPGPVLSGRLAVVETAGVPKELAGRAVEFAFQAPDRLRVEGDIDSRHVIIGRNGPDLWVHVPTRQFGVIGQPGRPRFASAPGQLDDTRLGPLRLPVSRWKLRAASVLLKVDRLPAETVEGQPCQVLRVSAGPLLARWGKLPAGEARLWLREADLLPARVRWEDGKAVRVAVEFQRLALGPAWPAEKWNLAAAPQDKIETVAVSHLARFFPSALSLLSQELPTLGPAQGRRRVLASEGQGRLEEIDGTRVLFLKGSPAAMGRQHGVLLRKGVRDLVSRVLYGVGVGGSFEKGRWFFGEIERAEARLEPFIDRRYLEEMDAMAAAAGLERQEIRLANFFPELFHCSGFALFGKATAGGRMYHGRVLDYMKGIGLEPNAAVIVHQPDYGHAWVNISYAGFVGSVTAMNDQHISIGEMGGRGEGNWDGKPMAQLLREVMEKASTLDEAVEIMRRGPRTCEYYYVIADGRARRAVGLAATPEKLEVIQPGQAHERLPHPFADAVLMSAGDRYEKLAERVREGYGGFDDDKARHLMDRPVAMRSNIHSVLFAPDTLDFWVANADGRNVASHTRYTHYNLAELLPPPGGLAKDQLSLKSEARNPKSETNPNAPRE